MISSRSGSSSPVKKGRGRRGATVFGKNRTGKNGIRKKYYTTHTIGSKKKRRQDEATSMRRVRRPHGKGEGEIARTHTKMAWRDFAATAPA